MNITFDATEKSHRILDELIDQCGEYDRREIGKDKDILLILGDKFNITVNSDYVIVITPKPETVL